MTQKGSHIKCERGPNPYRQHWLMFAGPETEIVDPDRESKESGFDIVRRMFS